MDSYRKITMGASVVALSLVICGVGLNERMHLDLYREIQRLNRQIGANREELHEGFNITDEYNPTLKSRNQKLIEEREGLVQKLDKETNILKYFVDEPGFFANPVLNP